MSFDESWEYAEAMCHADNVSETLCPYLMQKHLWLKLWVEARHLGTITSPPPDQSPFGGVDLFRRTSASWTAPGAASPHQPRLQDFESELWATFHARIKRELPITPLLEEANQRLLTYGNYNSDPGTPAPATGGFRPTPEAAADPSAGAKGAGRDTDLGEVAEAAPPTSDGPSRSDSELGTTVTCR